MYWKCERGFSFLEMMAVSALLTLVTTGVTSLVSRTKEKHSNEEVYAEAMLQSREIVNRMVREISKAGYPTTNILVEEPEGW